MRLIRLIALGSLLVLFVAACGEGGGASYASVDEIVVALEGEGIVCVDRRSERPPPGEGPVIDEITACDLAAGNELYILTFPSAADRQGVTEQFIEVDCAAERISTARYVFGAHWLLVDSTIYDDPEATVDVYASATGGIARAVDCGDVAD